MFKKLLISILVISMIWMLNINYIFADDEDEDEIETNEIEEVLVQTSNQTSDEPNLNCRAAIIYDRATKKVMWGKNQDEKRAMASTTKIMTAIVVLENSNLSDVVTISKKAAGTGGSRLKICAGDKITVNDLLYGLMLRSRK